MTEDVALWALFNAAAILPIASCRGWELVFPGLVMSVLVGFRCGDISISLLEVI